MLNSPVKKILTLVSIPVNVLTLGLFSLVINMLIFYLFAGVINSYFSPDISVQLGTLLQVFILSIIMSVCSSFLSKLL
ncbi:phage holin family protein [bacterium]|nr:phage holin family protein [bacterium]